MQSAEEVLSGVSDDRVRFFDINGPSLNEFAMIFPNSPKSDEVEHLLRNAQLRDELEPLYDESIGRVNAEVMSTSSENEFLQSMLDWERAPILPICDWFRPALKLPPPETLDDECLHSLLHETIQKLFAKRIVLDFTDHLSDRQLYCLIVRDILPTHEKRIERLNNYLHWDCANTNDNPDVWLRYYAREEDRDTWVEETGGELPKMEDPPYDRRLPRAPL